MKRKVGALEKVEADLVNLRHKIVRDPPAYSTDFDNQYNQFQSHYTLLTAAPASASTDTIDALKDLIEFVSHVAEHFPSLTAQFPGQLIDILNKHHADLDPELREKVVGSLVILRRKDVIDSVTLLNSLFPILVSTPSKSLRTLLYTKILSDVRNANAKGTNHKLNRNLQNVLYSLLTSDRSSSKGVWAVRITRELWRRQIWVDAKAVEIMKEAALAGNNKVVIGGIVFFLGGDKEREEAAEESSDEEGIDMRKLRHQAGINKKSKKKERELKTAAATVKKKERKKKQAHPLNFSALHLLHDPQSFAEILFSKHLQNNKSSLNLEQKLQTLQLVSRLVGLHKLTIDSLYSYFLKYLTPRQPSVTSFLASLAQATHELVPPDFLEPLIVKIANEFVSEAAAGQVAAAGLNAIRETCGRQPLAMSETLLQDLVMYRKSKDKGVMMAAKGLMSLYRNVAPEKLHKRDRGKDASLGIRAGAIHERRFGEVEASGIEGLDLLEKYKEDERRQRRIEAGLDPDASGDELDEDEDWKAWDVESDDSESSAGWIDVSSDGENIDVSDSEDEKPPAKKSKTEEPAASSPMDKAGAEQSQFSKLATTRILTPADLAKLNELRVSSAVQAQLPSNKRKKAQSQSTWNAEDAVTAESIEAAAALGKKATKEEKIAAAKKDRDEVHKSTAAKRKDKLRESGKSSTNREKARQKNFMMTIGKARGKQKRSLRDVGKALRGHIDRQKRGGRRGNR